MLRAGLRAVPGEPSESPSPATSWISRARMATSFTSVWLSLQPPGQKADAAGTTQGAAQGRPRSRSQAGLHVPAPRRMGQSPSQETGTVSGQGRGCSLWPGPDPAQPAAGSAPLGGSGPRCSTGWRGRSWGRARAVKVVRDTHRPLSRLPCDTWGHTSPALQAGKPRQGSQIGVRIEQDNPERCGTSLQCREAPRPSRKGQRPVGDQEQLPEPCCL